MTGNIPRLIQIEAAYNHLSQDPNLKDIVCQWGFCSLQKGENYYFELCRSIIAQQISTKVANKITSRLTEMFDGNVTPEKADVMKLEDLREVGISQRKAQTIKTVAQYFLDQKLDPAGIDEMSDEEIHLLLTKIKGVGTWTVTMFLIFAMNRPRIIPAHDFGIRKAIKLLFDLEEMPGPEIVTQYYQSWAPHETVASWYLWRSLDNI